MVRKGGFILIEFLVVAMLLTILAAVVPRIAGVGMKTKSSAHATDLLRVRPKVELHKLHHNDQLPAETDEIGGDYADELDKAFKIRTQPGRQKI